MRRYLWLVLVMLAACWPEPPPPPALELDLYDQPATCDPIKGTCRTADGKIAAPEYHRIRVRLTELPSSTTYPKGGLLITGQLRRSSGDMGYLSIQIPMVRSTITDTTEAPGEPRVEYTEYQGAKVLFSATHVAGRIELSWDRGCPCQTGRLELLLRDSGDDGVIDTADDQTRRISKARLRRGVRPFCHRRAVLEIKTGLLVVGSRSCPVKRSGGGGGHACGWGVGGGWFSGWNDDGWYDEEWDGDWDSGWDDEDFDDGWCDCDWTDDDYYYDGGWSDDGWGGGWCDDGWGSGWGDDGWGGGSSGSSSSGWDDDDWWDDGGSSGWGGSDSGSDWGSDDWWDDSDSGSDDWGSDDSGSDWGDSGGDDWGDDDWWDD
jgi:hypothetical protein